MSTHTTQATSRRASRARANTTDPRPQDRRDQAPTEQLDVGELRSPTLTTPNGINTLPPLIPVPTAAKLLGISRSAAYRYATAGQLPTRNLGGRVYIVTALATRVRGGGYRRILVLALLGAFAVLAAPPGQALIVRFVSGFSTSDPATAFRVGEYANALTL